MSACVDKGRALRELQTGPELVKRRVVNRGVQHGFLLEAVCGGRACCSAVHPEGSWTM